MKPMMSTERSPSRAAPSGSPPSDAAAGSDPVRLLLVVDGVYPSLGGAEIQARMLARVFTEDGHDVRVIAPWLDRTRPLRETLDGVPVERIPYPRIRLLGALLLCVRFAWRLLRDRGGYDAIHVHTAENLAAIAGLLRPWHGASVTVKVSGAYEFDGGLLDPELRHRPLNRLRNAWIQRADTIQCISRYTFDRLVAAGYPHAGLKMIPNAVDLRRFGGPRSTSGMVRVAYVGRLRQVKGVTVLLDAWHQLAPGAAARLVIAGEGELRPELEAQLDRLALRGAVELAGAISDVPALLRDTDVYVQPSFAEGMPNSVLEAMAAGLPVVATRVSGNEDLIADGENGLLVPPGDPGALAAAIRRLMDDPALARTMGERARTRAQQYSTPAVTSLLVRAYRLGRAA